MPNPLLPVAGAVVGVSTGTMKSWKSEFIFFTFPKIISEIRYLDFFEFISTVIMSNQGCN